MGEKLDALRDLLAKVEAGDVRPYKIEEQAAEVWEVQTWKYVGPAYSGSLDAAKALHEAVLPKRYWRMEEWDGAWTVQIPVSTFKRHEATSEASPARAWLIAILRALIAPEATE